MPAITDLQKELNFTRENGIKIQTDQLQIWESVLKEEAFIKLQKEVQSTNGEAEDGFDICRGEEIDNILIRQIFNPDNI